MFFTAPTIATLLFRLKGSLATAHMGTRLYLSGTEGFIGQAMLVALDYGMDHASVITEHRGSLARRVQCVHCKGVTDDVTTSPFACSHCGLTLWCATIIRAGSPPSRESISMRKNRAARLIRRSCSFERWH